VVSKTVDGNRHRVADKLIYGFHVGVAARPLAICVWRHNIIDERIVQPLRNFMAQGVDVLDGTTKMSTSFQSANRKVCTAKIVAVRTGDERVMVAQHAAAAERVTAVEQQ
jgi:hypothetical protein